MAERGGEKTEQVWKTPGENKIVLKTWGGEESGKRPFAPTLSGQYRGRGKEEGTLEDGGKGLIVLGQGRRKKRGEEGLCAYPLKGSGKRSWSFRSETEQGRGKLTYWEKLEDSTGNSPIHILGERGMRKGLELWKEVNKGRIRQRAPLRG